MPVGCGKRCHLCYWDESFQRRLDSLVLSLSSPLLQERFLDYGLWLQKRIGSQSASIRIRRYLPFFLEINQAWPDVPSYAELLSRFGVAQLRRVLLPVRWMDESRLIKIDRQAALKQAEFDRIRQSLNQFERQTQEHAVLEAFFDCLKLRFRQGKTTPNSMRLAFCPAVALLKFCGSKKCFPPTQHLLNQYLQRTPGQRNAISLFVSFLRKRSAADLRLPPYKSSNRVLKRKHRLEREMITLLREGGHGKVFEQKWRVTALAYFHGIAKSAVKRLQPIQIQSDVQGGWNILLSGQTYWIPPSQIGFNGISLPLISRA